MYIPKRYGESKAQNCPFCGKSAVVKNSQGVPVCSKHKDKELENMKCACGEYLEVRAGEWGPYFNCLNCGNINFKKAIEINADISKEEPEEIKKVVKQEKKEEKKEITITSDQLDYMY